MSYKGRKLTEEHKKKLSKSHNGKLHTKETKRKISIATNGKNNPFYGKHHTEETKRKISEYRKSKTRSEETRRKISESHKGIKKKPHTEEAKRKMSLAHKGNKSHLGCKHSAETVKKMSGKNHHNWQGGTSFEPYDLKFNYTLKKQIRERDGRCMLCNISLEDLELLKRRIAIHHIDYNKKNSFPQNLITLCVKCHSLTNFNRDQWVVFFQKLLAEEYEYKYSKDQKIILDFTKVIQ